MPCTITKDDKGQVAAIICTRGAKKRYCEWCGRESGFLCDFELQHHVTCDKRMCGRHATRVAAGTDYCPEHIGKTGQEEFNSALARNAAQTQ